MIGPRPEVGPRYRGFMSATYSVEPGPPRHPLARGASPEAIRSALLPEDWPAFDDAYATALADARASLDLTTLFTTLERWRGRAVLQSDPARFQEVARKAAEKLTGRPSPEDEPLSVTRAKAGM